MRVNHPQSKLLPETLLCSTCGKRPIKIRCTRQCKACYQSAWAKKHPKYFATYQRDKACNIPQLYMRLEQLSNAMGCTVLDLLSFIWSRRLKNKVRKMEDERALKAEVN